MVIWETFRKCPILPSLVQATFWPALKMIKSLLPQLWVFWLCLACLFPTGVQLVVGVNKLKMWSELAPLPFQAKVLSAQCASNVPAMNQLHSEGSGLLSSIYQAGLEESVVALAPCPAHLADPLKPFKHVGPLVSTFASHINKLRLLPCWCYLIRVPTIMTGFRIEL